MKNKILENTEYQEDAKRAEKELKAVWGSGEGTEVASVGAHHTWEDPLLVEGAGLKRTDRAVYTMPRSLQTVSHLILTFQIPYTHFTDEQTAARVSW